jgi:hypothetical protein
VSNHLAIATTTATFGRMLGAAAQIGVQNAALRFGPPDTKTGSEGKPIVNLFLYQVLPNAQNRNAHMPGRRSGGSIANRSRVALDLRYVLSFYGDASKFEPERMAGVVVASFEDRPLLSRSEIKKAVTDANSNLAGSDLEDALATVRITPENHSFEDLSRMWSIFFQVPYALSFSYLLSHVSIEIGDPAREALPVATPRLMVSPLARLRIEEVTAGAPGEPILWGDTLVLHGRGLGAVGLTLRIGALAVTPQPGEATDREIRLPLTAARLGSELPAGFHAVQAVLPPPLGGPAHLARASEARMFSLRPRITVMDAGLDPNPPVATAKGTMRISVTPAVRQGQVVSLLLDERTAEAPAAATLTPATPAAFPEAELKFAYDGLKLATYLVRALVDGVGSAPEIDATPGSPTFGEITGPQVDLT